MRADWSVARRALAALLFVSIEAAVAQAEQPCAESVLAKMKAALEPSKSSTRTITFTIHSTTFNEDTKVTALQARKTFGNGARSVTVITNPQTLKGIALLAIEQEDRPHSEYVYLPTLRRVRHLVGVSTFEPFLSSDFTYADLGLMDIQDRALKLRSGEMHNGTKAYEIEERPIKTWYYSRIVDWIAVDSGLPLERNHYDVSDAIWRIQTFDNVQVIDGVATPMRVRIDDIQSHDWSEYVLRDVRYDAKLSDELFDPAKLPEVAGSSEWGTK